MDELLQAQVQALRKAAHLQIRGRLDEAKKAYMGILKAAPACGEALVGLGLVLRRMGHHQASCDMLAKASLQDAEAACWSLHLLYASLGSVVESETALVQCIHMNPRHQGACNALLELFLDRAAADATRAGDEARALAYFHQSRTKGGHPASTTEVSSRIARSVKEHSSLSLSTAYHQLRPPKTLPVFEHAIFGDHEPFENRQTTSNELYVAEVQNATVFAKSDLVLVDEGEDKVVLCDNLRHPLGRYVALRAEPRVLLHDGLALLIDTAADKTIRYENAIMLLGVSTGSYGHWIYEHFPKLDLFSQANLPGLAGTPILVDEKMPESHKTSLSMALGGNHPIHYLKKGQSAKIKRLYVAPVRTFLPQSLTPEAPITIEVGPTDPDGLETFAQTCMAALGLSREGAPEKKRRIFLSRRHCHYRLCENEAEVIAALQHLGFKVCYPEEMDFVSQVKMFNSAEMIVGPNGSAFTNILFAKSACAVAMLFSPHLGNWISWLNAMASLGYHPVGICGQTSSHAKAGTLAAKQSSYRVDLKLVIDVVKDLITKTQMS